MTNPGAGGAHLENVMFTLMDRHSGGNADQYDTMIMISLVNLLGIISAMNKHWSAGPSQPAAVGDDPAMAALLKTLMEGQGQQMARGAAPGINPALLLSLLGPRAQRPETALLMTLLNNMMHQPPQAPPPAERSRQGAYSRPEAAKTPAGSKKEEDIQAGVLTWDRRLG